MEANMTRKPDYGRMCETIDRQREEIKAAKSAQFKAEQKLREAEKAFRDHNVVMSHDFWELSQEFHAANQRTAMWHDRAQYIAQVVRQLLWFGAQVPLFIRDDQIPLGKGRASIDASFLELPDWVKDRIAGLAWRDRGSSRG
jgi:hypothetical protein